MYDKAIDGQKICYFDHMTLSLDDWVKSCFWMISQICLQEKQNANWSRHLGILLLLLNWLFFIQMDRKYKKLCCYQPYKVFYPPTNHPWEPDLTTHPWYFSTALTSPNDLEMLFYLQLCITSSSRNLIFLSFYPIWKQKSEKVFKSIERLFWTNVMYGIV